MSASKYSQLVYVSDKGMYGLTKKVKLLNYDQALMFLGNTDKAREFLQSSTVLSYTYDQYEKYVGKTKPKHVYNNIRDHLPFMWKTTVRGELTLYKLNSGRELFPILPSAESFKNSIKADLALYDKVTEFLTDIDTVQLNPNMDFDALTLVLYNQLIQDREKRVAVDEIPLVSWNEDDYAFKKFSESEMVIKGETPAWDQFLERLDYPEVFMSWVWSVFDPDNEGRQALWIFGEGFDGKSTAIRAISRIFGLQQTFAVTHGSYREKWFFSEAYGKKLAVYSDCKNTRLISEARIHQLLGGDQVSVEFKGENGFMARVYCKLLIGSNFAPDVDFSKSSEATRLLYLEIKPLPQRHSNTYYEEMLVAEAPHFLHKCREVYEKYYPKFDANGKQYRSNELVPSDDHLLKMSVVCSSKETLIVDRFMQEELIFEETKDAYVRPEDLNVALKEFLGKYYLQEKLMFSMNDLSLRFRKKGIEKVQVMKKGKRFYAYKNVKLVNEVKVDL